MNSPIRYGFKPTTANEYMTLAEIKLYDARKSLLYSEYRLEHARWRISYDVVSKLLEYVVLYKDSYEKTLMGLPIDICYGRDILQLYVEV